MPGDTPDASSALVAIRAKTSAYLGALRIPVTILLLVGGVYGSYYFLYVTRERDYLTGRNFRLLATMGEQIEATIQNDQKVLDNLLGLQTPSGNGTLPDTPAPSAVTLEEVF